jgi:hypothetical protein
MSRTTVILALFVVLIGAIIGVSQFLTNQPPLELTVAVNPMVEDWLADVVQEFNQSDTLVNGTTRVQVKLTTVADNAIWNSESSWSTTAHPDVWIPADPASINYLSSNIPFEVVADSVATTPLVWGGFESRVMVLSPDGILDWDVVAAAMATDDGNWSSLGGERSWGYLKLAYPRPTNDIAGLAVLYSGAGYFTDSTTLDRQRLLQSDFNDWMQTIVDAVPSFNTLGSDPAATMASRGTSVAEVALLPEVIWLQNLDGLQGNDPIMLSYPSTGYNFTFPLAMWEDNNTSDTMKAAVNAFADYVTGDAQAQAVAYGLRPIDGIGGDAGALFGAGVDAGIMLDPPTNAVVTAPDKNTTETLLERFG